MADSGSGDAVSSRSDADYAVEFGRYLATAAEQFLAEQNSAQPWRVETQILITGGDWYPLYMSSGSGLIERKGRLT
jgi:hypothetical protein